MQNWDITIRGTAKKQQKIQLKLFLSVFHLQEVQTFTDTDRKICISVISFLRIRIMIMARVANYKFILPILTIW